MIDGTSDPILTRMVAEDKVPWYKKPNLRLLYFLLFPACMGIEMTSGFDSQLINALQIIPPFKKFFGGGYVNAKGVIDIDAPLLGILNASYSLGAICGVPFAPAFNQRVGRRWAIMAGSLIMIFGAILQGFARNVPMYIIARMFLGFGIVFCIISGSAMIGELSYPKERAIMTSCFNAAYFFGAIVAAAITLKTAEIKIGDWGWRIPSLIQCFPSLLQVIFIFFLPESPRYLISKDRDDEAFDILVKYHAEGDRDSVFVRAEMAQIKTTIKIELEYAKQSWTDMFKTAGMRRRVLIASAMGLFTQWSGNTLISYYTNTILEMIGYPTTYAKTRINIANNCWGLITAGIAALFVTRFPRRYMFLLSCTSMLCVFIGFTVASKYVSDADNHKPKLKNASASVAALFFFFAYSPCYNIGNNALTYTYLVELFPFAERARGIAVEQFFGRGAGFFTTFVNPIGMKAISWKYMTCYCAMLVIEITFVYFMYPETYGRTLEELAFLFEDKSLADNVVSAVEKQIHYGDLDPTKVDTGDVTHIEELSATKTIEDKV